MSYRHVVNHGYASPSPYVSIPYSREPGLRAGSRPAKCTNPACPAHKNPLLPNGERAVTCEVGETIRIECKACGKRTVDGSEGKQL